MSVEGQGRLQGRPRDDYRDDLFSRITHTHQAHTGHRDDRDDLSAQSALRARAHQEGVLNGSSLSSLSSLPDPAARYLAMTPRERRAAWHAYEAACGAWDATGQPKDAPDAPRPPIGGPSASLDRCRNRGRGERWKR